jgi:hypothetical protein
MPAFEVASLAPHPPSKLGPNLARIPQPDTQLDGRWGLSLSVTVWSCWKSDRLDGKDVPLLGHTFKGVDPSILEADTRARHQILHGRGDDDLIGAGKRRQAGGDSDGDAAYVVPDQLNLAGVQACPDMQAQRRDPTLDRADAADRAAPLWQCSPGTTSHQPSALLNTSRGTRSLKSSRAPMPPSAHRLVAPP